jgi:hypothetical protein
MAVKSKPPAVRVVVDSECGKLMDPPIEGNDGGQPGCHRELGNPVFFCKNFSDKSAPDDNLKNPIP